MKPFDLATWAAIVILVVGSLAVFLWFLKDAGKVLRGKQPEPRSPPAGPEPDPERGRSLPPPPPSAGTASAP